MTARVWVGRNARVVANQKTQTPPQARKAQRTPRRNFPPLIFGNQEPDLAIHAAEDGWDQEVCFAAWISAHFFLARSACSGVRAFDLTIRSIFSSFDIF